MLCFSTRFQFKLFTENAFGGNSCGADEDDDLRGERVVVVASLLGVTLDFNVSFYFSKPLVTGNSRVLLNLHPGDSLESANKHLPCDSVNHEVS